MDDATPATGETTGGPAKRPAPTPASRTRPRKRSGRKSSSTPASRWRSCRHGRWPATGLGLYGGAGSQEDWTPLWILWILPRIVIGLGTPILVLTWIYRANYNARQLGAADMRFTPGWAVGWYFIPIAWFWMPYLAMREIWRASVNPSDLGAAPVWPLLRWWWGLWIVPSWGLDGVDLVASFRLDEAGTQTVDAATDLVGYALDVPLAFVLVAIITAVTQLQTARDGGPPPPKRALTTSHSTHT